ncbi:glycoprotein Xg isoform X1 [Pelodiscus sinensis]|uniref:glycoprotein Xg isoform X1 n=1 Tax=Pelodiscus sinensis TaxID=13735 RepID=UPI003F6C198C
MIRLRTTLFWGLVFFLVHVRGQDDFDLADALDHPEETITKKPAPVTKRPVIDDRPKPHPGSPYNPGSYGNDGDNHPKPQPNPPAHPGRYSHSDGFNDLDLNGGKPLPPRPAGDRESNVNHGGNTDSGVVAGVTSPVVSVLVLLIVGTVAGYTAYKKKKLCFNANGGRTA